MKIDPERMQFPEPDDKEFVLRVQQELYEAHRRAVATISGVERRVYVRRNILRPGRCAGCGVPYDECNPNCHNCKCRHGMRRLTRRRRNANLNGA